jgi:NADH-quinone oxidoreductase subunit G
VSDPKQPTHPEIRTPTPGVAVSPPPPAPLAKPAVNLTIDGQAVQVPAGTNLIEAAARLGIEIPFYCYHKGLSIAGSCRMCLVEVSNAPPGKLVPACQTPAVEGQKVTTDSPRVVEQQRAVEEFLLLDHPVDCSICDQAGECKLQDYFMEFDHQPSRRQKPKWMKNKRKVLGPLVVLDQERCIMCTRCVRFMAEVPRDPVLGVFGRGSREVIDMFPGKTLDSNYSGNVVDLCPVGALTSRDFRFRSRAYFLTATPSLCTGCARGCNTFLDHFQNVPYRYRPRENLEVNRYWMCDLGRRSYHALYEERVGRPRIGTGAGARGAVPAEAVRHAAAALKDRAGAVAVVVSPVLSLEEALAACLVAAEGLSAKAIYVSGRGDGAGDDLLLRPDRNPNRRGVELAARAMGLEVKSFADFLADAKAKKVKAAALFGVDVPAEPAAAAAALGGLEATVALAANETPVTGAASVVLPLSTHAEDEGTFVNFEGRAQRFLRAYPSQTDARPAWAWAGLLLKELGLAYRYQTAREVFADLGRRLPAGALGSFDWDAVPRQILKGVTPLPGGTVDGRPPGWRELIPLRTSSASGEGF